MKRFTLHQRIEVVIDCELTGKTGTVNRIRYSDQGAWVRMDEDLPETLRLFPADDPEGRGKDIILYPHQCKAI